MNQAKRVDQQVALASLDQLAAIEATVVTTSFDGLDGLAVQDASRRLRVASRRTTDLSAQRIVQALPGAILPPPTEVGPGGAPWDQIARDHPPLGTTPRDVANGIEHLPQVGPWAATRVGRRQERLEDGLLCIVQVRRVDTRHA